MHIVVKKIKAPTGLNPEFERLVARAEKAGFVKLGWLTAKVFTPVALLGFVSRDRMVVLTVNGFIIDHTFVPEAFDFVSQLDSGHTVTTTTHTPVLPQPERGVFKYGHRKASLTGLLSHHQEHLAAHGGHPVAKVSTLEEMAEFIRKYLVHEMEGSLLRHWARANGKGKVRGHPPRDGLEGCYAEVGSPSLRVVMENGRYIWGGRDIHDSGKYQVISQTEHECIVKFQSAVSPASPKRVRITRRGGVYCFTELPGEDEVTRFTRSDGADFLADSRGIKEAKKRPLTETPPGGKYLPIDKTVEESEKGTFIQNVRKEVIPWLIKKGKLTGKTEKGKQHVLDNEAFRRYMRHGIERFVLNQQGWTFIAVKAAPDEVARVLKAREDVTRYRRETGASKLKKGAQAAIENGKRHIFLVHFNGTEWSVIIQTVHWIEASDIKLALALAGDLSRELKTRALAAFDDDFSGAAVVIFKSGKQSHVLRDEDDWTELYGFFYEE